MLKRAKELHVDKKIEWMGRREDIKQFYNAMDCFLLPSLYEGLPVVGLEAQCSGLPVFFSTEITREAKACDLASFLDLSMTDEEWADAILSQCKRVKIRRSYSKRLQVVALILKLN